LLLVPLIVLEGCEFVTSPGGPWGPCASVATSFPAGPCSSSGPTGPCGHGIDERLETIQLSAHDGGGQEDERVAKDA
jgi:hypothetical protein